MAVIPLSEIGVWGLDIGDAPSTEHFIRQFYHLFDFNIRFGLRKGAPLIQMLNAPEDFIEGCTEPWIVDVLCALLKASDQRSVVELGAFIGTTTLRLAQTLVDMGGGKLVACELDPERAAATQIRLESAALPLALTWRVVVDDALTWIKTQEDESVGLAWIDDDHSKAHVAQEIELLLPKMVRGGLICGHDVWGSTDLQEIFTRFQGYALDLPRLGPAGGLGILQVR